MLSEFRHRLVADRTSRRLFDLILDRPREAGLLLRPGGQHTDSTHVLAAVRRLENTAEHLRAALVLCCLLSIASSASLPRPRRLHGAVLDCQGALSVEAGTVVLRSRRGTDMGRPQGASGGAAPMDET